MTNAEFAILSLIVEQPRHGYEIEQGYRRTGHAQLDRRLGFPQSIICSKS